MNKHTHNRGDPHLYDNGCIVCDVIDSINGYAYGDGVYPPWIDTERQKEEYVIEDIRWLYNFLGLKRPTSQNPPGIGQDTRTNNQGDQ